MSYDEIADALGVRRAFVGVVLLRARMNCGRRWGKAARWPREGPREGGRKFVGRCRAASRRNDLFVVYRAATGPCAAQEVSAHTQECAACRTLLRALERESRLLTRAMLEEEEALPARLAQFQERGGGRCNGFGR